jgi:hypothetical protein
VGWQSGQPSAFQEEHNTMNMPKSISTWLMIIFFLLVGLDYLGIGIPGILTGLVALATAVVLFLGR